jgi:hypothetical protein
MKANNSIVIQVIPSLDHYLQAGAKAALVVAEAARATRTAETNFMVMEKSRRK